MRRWSARKGYHEGHSGVVRRQKSHFDYRFYFYFHCSFWRRRVYVLTGFLTGFLTAEQGCGEAAAPRREGHGRFPWSVVAAVVPIMINSFTRQLLG